MRTPTCNASEQLVGMLVQIIDGRAAEKFQEVWKAKMVVGNTHVELAVMILLDNTPMFVKFYT